MALPPRLRRVSSFRLTRGPIPTPEGLYISACAPEPPLSLCLRPLALRLCFPWLDDVSMMGRQAGIEVRKMRHVKWLWVIWVVIASTRCSGEKETGDVVFTPPGDTTVQIGASDTAKTSDLTADKTMAPDLCQPHCEAAVCGDDGCGGSCGDCPGSQETCEAGKCLCHPDCAGKACGDDGCGGGCGECAAPLACVEGSCLCLPDCTGKVCGTDGCNGSCGECGGSQDLCLDGACVCQPACDGKNCGADGCGNLCGECTSPQDECIAGLCTCIPACAGMACGDDGCGTTCGQCDPGDVCIAGACCTPQCEGLECGDDGCGSVCGECPNVQDICQEGLCVCIPDCTGKLCGSDGCLGSCGECPLTDVCFDGACCTPDCTGKLCGDNSCGGMCGNGAMVSEGCAAFATCNPDLLACETFPAPDLCLDKECGMDGLGGNCGTCPCPGCSQSALSCKNFQCTTQLGLECKGIFDCFGDCLTGDQICLQNCLGDGTPQATVIYNNLITCLDDAGYFDCPDGDDACQDNAFDSCMDQYYACFHGDEPCPHLYVCIIGCPAGDSDCSSNCFSSATIEALNVWDQFIGCLELQGYFECDPQDSACYDDAFAACDAEFLTCANGPLTCHEVLGCIKNCNIFDGNCPLGCRIQGTLEAQGAIDDIATCVEEHCEPVTGLCEQEVLLDECADTYAACLTL